MVSLEQIIYIVPLFALTASIIYYAINLRNANKTQQQQLETRQAQLFMDFYKTEESYEFGKITQEMVWEWEWTDYDDFQRKYQHIRGDTEDNAKMTSVFYHYEGMGVMAKRGLLSLDIIYEVGWRVINIWERFEPIIFEWRKQYPQLYMNWEWLYQELKKMQIEKGHEVNRNPL